MKVRLSELRRYIREELQLAEAVQNQSLQKGIQIITNAFPIAVTNEILNQKLGLNGSDNRTRSAAAEGTRQHVDAASQKFQVELNTLVEKHLAEAVNGFKQTGPAPQRPAPRPANGQNPDQRATMPPPSM